MRTETITKTYEIYTFEELPKEVQEKVLENNREINVDYDWAELIIDDEKEKLEELGFKNPEISCSGFYCQGDGASFTCKDIDLKKIIKLLDYKFTKKAFENVFYRDFTITIDRDNSNYVHEYSTSVNVEYGDYMQYQPRLDNKLEEIREEIEEKLGEHVVNLNREIYKSLEETYEYLQSDEAVKETLLCNEYEFTIDGDIY